MRTWRAGRVVGSATLAAAWLGSSGAWAQTGDPADLAKEASETQTRELVPPRAIDVSVTYPEGESGDEVVYLEFVVDGFGRVGEVKLISGREPFASAAREAAGNWVFEPARRGDEVLSVRIRFRVEYEDTKRRGPSVEAPVSSEQTPAEPAASGQAEAKLTENIEIVIEGEHRSRAVSLTTAEAREVPGAFGDPVRALEILPGVTPIVSALPLFFVRGAPPGNVGFFIDGIPVPLLYHAFLGAAVVHPAMIERVDLHRGPYPVRYGRYAGAVAEFETARPQGTLRGEASLRLSDAGAFLEVPLFGGRGSALIGGRYSFSSLVLSQFVEGALEYWDYQALTTYELDPQNRLGIFAFGAFDLCSDLCSNDETVSGSALATGATGVEFHRVDVRWDHDYARGRLRTAVTGGYDRSRAGLGFNASSELAQVRVEHDHRFSRQVAYRAGVDAALRDYDLENNPFSENFDDIRDLFFGRTERVYGVHTEFRISAGKRVTIVPGLRADFFQSAGDDALGIDPRLGVSFRLTEKTRALAEAGLSHQLPNYVPNVPGIQVAGIPQGLQKALHTSSGFESELPAQMTLALTLFNNAYYDLTDPLGISQNFVLDSTAARKPLRGTSQGLEVYLRRPLTHRVGGILSYTLSRTTRHRDDVTTLAAYDRPHVVNAALSCEPFDDWRIGARTLLYSGIPGSRVTSDSDGPVFDQGRGPAFFRLDLRLERRGRLGNWGSWIAFAEVLNATFSREVVRRQCPPNGCVNSEVGPLVLPNLGVEVHY